MTKVFVLTLALAAFCLALAGCGNSGTPQVSSAPVVDFAAKLSTAHVAESNFENALAAAPDLQTALASDEFKAMQTAMSEAKAAAQSDADKTSVDQLQKLIDVLVNQ